MPSWNTLDYRDCLLHAMNKVDLNLSMVDTGIIGAEAELLQLLCARAASIQLAMAATVECVDRAPSPYDEYLSDNYDLTASLLSSHQSLLVTGFPSVASADSAWATSHLVASDFMLNSTDCKSIDSAAIKLLELLQTDWPQPQFTLRQKVAVGDIFFGTVKQKRSACTVSFSFSEPLEENIKFMFYHRMQGRQPTSKFLNVLRDLLVGCLPCMQ